MKVCKNCRGVLHSASHSGKEAEVSVGGKTPTMQIYQDNLSEITRYIENNRHLRLEDMEAGFQNYIRHIERHKRLNDPNVRILEIGTGTGWFPLMCKLKGISCKGLEISPQLITYARELGASYGVEPDIELGNIEDGSIADCAYDVVVAMSIFEHVEDWRRGLRNVYRILQPGGVLIFESTNKFSFTSGEYNFPLYGWLPDTWRYRLRVRRQGPDVMRLGIDFNQFRYPLLRRAFRDVGFRIIEDRFDLSDPSRISSSWKSRIIRLCKGLRPARHLALTFIETTNFVCVK
jgi:SAM-dependent methyltransferase